MTKRTTFFIEDKILIKLYVSKMVYQVFMCDTWNALLKTRTYQRVQLLAELSEQRFLRRLKKVHPEIVSGTFITPGYSKMPIPPTFKHAKKIKHAKKLIAELIKSEWVFIGEVD